MHLARNAAEREVGEDHRLRRREVPRLAGRLLVVPEVFAGVGVEREHARQEQVVALAVGANQAIPRAAVARADVELIELGVVDDRVPRRAAAAHLVPAAEPRRRGDLGERFVRGRAVGAGRGIAGHDVEAPRELARVRVVGADVAAHAELGAGVADDDFVLHDARRARDRVHLRLIDGDRAPDRRARRAVERDEPAVERRDDELVHVERRPARVHVAASFRAGGAGHFRVVAPDQLARRGVQRVGFAPRARRVEHAVGDERRRFLAAIRIELVIPSGREPAQRFLVDLASAASGVARDRCRRA